MDHSENNKNFIRTYLNIGWLYDTLPWMTRHYRQPQEAQTQLLPNNLLNLNSSASFYHFRSNWKASIAKKKVTLKHGHWSISLARYAGFFVDPGKLKRTTTFLRHHTAFLFRLWATFELVVMISNQTIP